MGHWSPAAAAYDGPVACVAVAPEEAPEMVSLPAATKTVPWRAAVTASSPGSLLENRGDPDPVSRRGSGRTKFSGRLRQSGPRPEGRLLRQPALEGLTRSAQMETPRKVGRNKFRRGKAATAARGTGGGREVFSRGNRHFTIGGGRLRQSGPRPEGRLLRQPALEGLTRSARTDFPRKTDRSKSDQLAAAAAAAFGRGGRRVGALGRSPQNPLPMLNTLSSVSVRESRIQYLCDPQWFRDTASRGPPTIVAPESQFRTCPSDHDSIGYPHMSASGESSTKMHRLLHVSGSHPIPPPNDPNRLGRKNEDKAAELETSICDAKYHVSLSTRSVLGKWVYLVTLAMSLFDLQDVCIAIGSIATLDLPMLVDLIGIYGLKGSYCTLTTTNWFLQALSVIPRGSWGDVARCSYHDPLGKSGIVIPEPQWLWAHG
ncbi:putative histone-lysine N-methyltransferase ATXR3 [Dorcoceras hygrometricum]|uniref:Putative histone-lysine N-methyltransferase ATXR3 n=1 Tax=Dorcoceras hygrometricum TaxID=472368 RepID=A0A2Z7A6Z2_9LAMI|nr:putative histone-lysine N-methyltransferase ATXR3 [Dorcoceras hygrometricum]